MVEVDRVGAPRFGRRFDEAALLRELGDASVTSAWERLLGRPYPFCRDTAEAGRIEEICPGETARVLASADAALDRRIDLLGSGPVELGTPIEWHCDFKTGRVWPITYGPRIEYVNLDQPSDVKMPWEISRLQWLLPVGQAYVLTGDERYARGARAVIEEWIAANPYPLGVNWAIAMEPAFRIFSLSWLFHALASSDAWADPGFRTRFLRALFLHGLFVERHIERSHVNGNHYTADAAALVAAGLFFGEAGTPARWARNGWRILEEELPLQIGDDGVDFEASAAYHRLVVELFLLPALLRRAAGDDVPAWYVDRLAAAAAFTTAYVRPDGRAPLWGDADDARVLPLGSQRLDDHRYLPGLVGTGLARPGLAYDLGDPRSELAWLLGPAAAESLAPGGPPPRPAAFPTAGVYALAGGRDHVFVDAGPVGLAGGGGHGHNDCLSFEATLDGIALVTDCGSYVYTASADWRNRFRSTAFHNTPCIDGVEQNRIDPGSLWRLEEDAAPIVIEWNDSQDRTILRARHHGYRRLSDPVVVERLFVLQPRTHALVVVDRFDGAGNHRVEVPLHLAPGVALVRVEPDRWILAAHETEFALVWLNTSEWELAQDEGWVSPSYGVKEPTTRLRFIRDGRLRPLAVAIAPLDYGHAALDVFARDVLLQEAPT